MERNRREKERGHSLTQETNAIQSQINVLEFSKQQAELVAARLAREKDIASQNKQRLETEKSKHQTLLKRAKDLKIDPSKVRSFMHNKNQTSSQAKVSSEAQQRFLKAQEKRVDAQEKRDAMKQKYQEMLEKKA